MKELVLEPRIGGRWYEVGEDGRACDWGKVLAYEPPTSIVLAWQLNQDWKYDASFVTELEVRFVAEGTATRVELEHRNLDRFGARADALRADLDSQEGWTGALVAFAAYLDRSLAEGGSEMSHSQFFLCRFILETAVANP